MKSAFDFDDYKSYLVAVEASRKSFERGFRSKLASFIGCQSGYISHVLNGTANLSLEQALLVSRFLNMNDQEEDYFLLLVEHLRAGTNELREHFDKKLAAVRDLHLNVKKRVGDARALSEIEQSTYYSSWYFVAVHVVASLPGYSDAKVISRALQIPEEKVKTVLLFLIEVGILLEERGILKSGKTEIHLNRESPLIRQHHTNARIAAIHSLTADTRTDLHYSTLSSLSKKDAEKLKLEMVGLIESYVEVVKPSKEEVVYGFNLDFFSVVRA